MNGNEILTHAVPIWFAGSTSMPDEYAEFDADFSAENTGKFEFYIAAGSEYSLYLDGRLIGFGQYQDYPGRLIYDTLTFDAEAGEHTLRVIAWHWGVDSFTHTKRPPYVIFGLRGTAGEQALVSSENTPSRQAAQRFRTIRDSPSTAPSSTWSARTPTDAILLPTPEPKKPDL